MLKITGLSPRVAKVRETESRMGPEEVYLYLLHYMKLTSASGTGRSSGQASISRQPRLRRLCQIRLQHMRISHDWLDKTAVQAPRRTAEI